jgi:2-C-methyl-D-erythritol 4-phosphate cytidylyltransferase
VSVTALIPAAGRGTRIGGARPKQFLPLAGVPMLARTLAAFQSSDDIDAIVVVVPAGEETSCRDDIVARYGVSKATRIVAGGASRQASVAAGLRALGADASIVVIHDAARPFVTAGLIRRVLAAAESSGAAIAALPVVDTLKRRSPDGRGLATVEREGLWAAQTPQAFRRDLIVEACARAAADGFLGTDDASLVERLGHPVTLVEGDPSNLKITRAGDLRVAEDVVAVGEPGR